MRHGHGLRKLNRTSSHRLAMLQNMMNSLIEHEVIKTTVPKAKELRRVIEPMITLAKNPTLANKRLAFDRLRSRDSVVKLFGELGPRYQAAPSRGNLYSNLFCSLRFRRALLRVRIGAIHEFDKRHGRVVADAETHLEDACVAARARLVTRAQFTEQLGDAIAIAKAVERQAHVRNGGFLAERNHGFDDAAQFLGLGDRGLDDFVLDERIHHVAQHGEPMRAGAIEFSKSVSVTHGAFLSL